MPAELKQTVAERRKTARQRSFLRGTVYFNERHSALDCLVRDLSPHGARLEFSETATIPDVIDLHIPQKDRTLHAQVVWRHGEDIGVVFPEVAESHLPTDTADLGQRVVRLEAEVAVLRRMLRKLQSDGSHEFESD